ncbi:MAG TPA: 8-amino-7-oxononanoate synthase [Kofleriaceae bacterium]|nr:8-amino-7-oxononanoate synthase [Kofleriaceae bacterium]
MTLDDEARAELRELAAAHRLRAPRVVDGAPGPRIVLDGSLVLNLASNDYLGLAGDRRLSRAAAAALEETGGVGAGASRLIAGNHRAHAALEAAVGAWMRCAGARVFGSGYAANSGVIAALARAGDAIFSDELNHASIIDGCRLSRADVVVFPHGDLAALEAALASSAARARRRRLVVSESLFSMDGDLADVERLAALCRRHDAALVLDEAHAIGVLGPEGRGVAAAAGVVPDVVIGTFGKALGTYGAFAATTRAVADLLWNRARPFVFSTGMPPAVAAATAASIQIVRGAEGDDRRRAVAAHARRLRAGVPAAGGASESPIAPIRIDDDRRVMAISARLLEAGVFVQGIRPPTVPPGTARLRVGLMATMALPDLERAIAAIAGALADGALADGALADGALADGALADGALRQEGAVRSAVRGAGNDAGAVDKSGAGDGGERW